MANYVCVSVAFIETQNNALIFEIEADVEVPQEDRAKPVNLLVTHELLNT
jgi:hypothetical protein